MPLQTRLTETLEIEHPILLAPMDLVASGKLAAAVSHAGGLGLIGGGYGNADWLSRSSPQQGNARIGCGLSPGAWPGSPNCSTWPSSTSLWQ
jgi:nitronate monooxygenase